MNRREMLKASTGTPTGIAAGPLASAAAAQEQQQAGARTGVAMEDAGR